MNKINIYVLTFFLSLAGVSIYAQNNRSQVVITSGQDNNVFFHTIEKGQTVYAIATMYGVTPDDIYRLNPDSKEGIKAGATLKIPQRDIVGGTAKKQDGNYIFHTIQPKETLYSLSIRYTVPATAIVKRTPDCLLPLLQLARQSAFRRRKWKIYRRRSSRPLPKKLNIPSRKRKPCTGSAGNSIFPATS